MGIFSNFFRSESKQNAQYLSLTQLAEPYIAMTTTLRDFKVQDYVPAQELGKSFVDDEEVPMPVELFFKRKRDANMTIKYQMTFKDGSCFYFTIFETFVTIDLVINGHSHGVLVLTPRQESGLAEMPYLQGVLAESSITDLMSSMSSQEFNRGVQLDAANLFTDVRAKLRELEGR